MRYEYKRLAESSFRDSFRTRCEDLEDGGETSKLRRIPKRNLAIKLDSLDGWNFHDRLCEEYASEENRWQKCQERVFDFCKPFNMKLKRREHLKHLIWMISIQHRGTRATSMNYFSSTSNTRHVLTAFVRIEQVTDDVKSWNINEGRNITLM